MFGSRNVIASLALAAVVFAGAAAESAAITQVSVPIDAAGAQEWSYADIADLFGPAPIVARARIVDATRIKDAQIAPRSARFFVEADVIALIRGSGGLPPRISYLADVPTDSRGRPPKLRKSEVLLAALPVPARPNEIRLAAPDAQRPWTAPLEARIRALLAAIAAPGAAPVITGVSSAFHVAGSIPGEGETQLFLSTATGAPVSLTILRRPSEAPRWALALGEIVDEAAGPPARDTLAWYRLACFLPPALPDAAAAELASVDANAARADYGFVIAQLGSCARTRR